MANNLKFYDETQTHSISLNIPTPTGTTTVTMPSSGTVGTTTDIATAKQEAINAGLGVGQTWQDVTASRAGGTTYTNSTGKPIIVNAYGAATVNAGNIAGYVNGVSVFLGPQVPNTYHSVVTFIVPNGATYSVTFVACTQEKWFELR